MLGFKTILAAVISLISGGTVNAVDIQSPSGEFKVAISHLAFNDSSVTDPFASSKTSRKLMTTLYFPIEAKSCTVTCPFSYVSSRISDTISRQFLKDGTASSSAMDITRMNYLACCGTNSPLEPKKHGLVFLEPGFGTSRLMYGALANEIASHGHAVIVIDHPYDASIVEYTTPKENTFIEKTIQLDPMLPNGNWNKTISKIVETRINDIYFIAKSLLDLNTMNQYFAPHDFIKPFSSIFVNNKMGIVGHGLGGTVATALAIRDPRFKVSINMDGSAPPVLFDTLAPIVFFGRSDHRREHDDLWKKAWPHFKGDKVTEFDMKDGGLFDYSDLPLIANLLNKDKAGFKGLGTVKDRRGWETAGSFAAAYCKMEFSTNWRKGAALSDLVRKYPEMVPYPGL